MKIKRYTLERMNIEALAVQYDLTMVVRERHSQDDETRFYAQFEQSDIVMSNGFLIREYGNGRTENEAIDNYATAISGKCLAIGASTSDRWEIQVPVLSRYKG